MFNVIVLLLMLRLIDDGRDVVRRIAPVTPPPQIPPPAKK